jgi:hypothetical protein
MPKIDDATFMGSSGAKYRFEVHQYGAPLDPVAGVYIITKRVLRAKVGGAGYAGVYTGETGNLSQSMAHHPRAECFASNGINSVCILVEADEAKRKATLADLKEGYGLLCAD